MTPELHEALSLIAQIWGWLLGTAACVLALHLLTRTDTGESPRQPQPCRHYDPSLDIEKEVRVETHA
jgi:hypothetical protein